MIMVTYEQITSVFAATGGAEPRTLLGEDHKPHTYIAIKGSVEQAQAILVQLPVCLRFYSVSCPNCAGPKAHRMMVAWFLDGAVPPPNGGVLVCESVPDGVAPARADGRLIWSDGQHVSPGPKGVN